SRAKLFGCGLVALIDNQETLVLLNPFGQLCSGIEHSDVYGAEAEAQATGYDVNLVKRQVKLASRLLPPLFQQRRCRYNDQSGNRTDTVYASQGKDSLAAARNNADDATIAVVLPRRERLGLPATR